MSEQPTRARILGTWAYACVMVSLGASALAMTLSSDPYPFRRTSAADTTFFDVLLASPIGWGASIIFPLAWINLMMLAFAVFTRRAWPLWICVVVSFIHGCIWPSWFVAMMGI